MKISLSDLRNTKIPADYDAVVIDPDAGGMIYPVDGQQDERYQKLSAEDKRKYRGKLPITLGMALSKGDTVASASGVKVKFKDPGWRQMVITLQNDLKGREALVGDYTKTRPKREQTIEDWIESLAFRALTPSLESVEAEFRRSLDRVYGGTAITGVRGESVVKIKVGDLRALIREAAKRRPSGWLPATEKNLDLDKPFTADSWITNQTGVPVNVLVKNYLASMGMLEEEDE